MQIQNDHEAMMDMISVESMNFDASDAQKEAVHIAVTAALESENAGGRRVSVVLTDDDTIHEYNRSYRSVDRATDVLSFPADEGDYALAAPPDGFLGDIMISVPRAKEQGIALGHSTEREIMFLAVHGTLHLLGYDHMKPDDEEEMLDRQREIMKRISEDDLSRLEQPTAEEIAHMLALANEAKERAYAPYSGFRVGACLKAASGQYYLGCNIENAGFTPTNCAERTALFTAVCAGERDFTALAITSDGDEFTYPCGVCRQALAEFCAPWVPIICAESGGRYVIKKLGALLPMAFTGAMLGRKEGVR